MISTTAHGIPYTITHNENCLLVPPSDSKNLADSILNLIENPSKCQKLADSGFNMVNKEANLTSMTNGMLNVYENGRNLDKNFPTDRIIDTFTEEIADKLIPNYFKMDKRLEEEELQVTDWDILMGFVASGVEPRGIKLVDNFYDKYKEIFENEMKSKGYFQIIKRSPLYICKKK